MSIVPHPAGWGEMATGNLGDFFGGADLRTATAVIDLSGGRERQFDYRAYANKIDAVAEMLMRHGLARGARVAILGRNSTEYRSEEHTSELQSLMRISYAVFCLKKKKNITQITHRL